MRLKIQYILFVILLHIIFFSLSLQLLDQQRWWFLFTEILILLSIGFSVKLYRSLIRPVNLITAGTETMKDQDFSTTFVNVGQPEMDHLIDVYNRMIEQLRDERVQQQEQHFFLERLVEASPIGIIILDYNSQVRLLNPAAELMIDIGKEALLGRQLNEFSGQLISEIAVAEPGAAGIITINGLKAYKFRVSQFRNLGFYQQFIMIEEMAEEIFRSEKRAYEKIIRQMSHEINNSIGAVNSILDSFRNYRQHLPEDDRLDFDKAIDVCITRNRHLNQFMSNYAEVVRLPAPVRKKYDVNEIIKTVALLTQAECQRRNIEWKWELADRPVEIDMDMQQIEHVFLNIVRNGMEAIDKNGSILVQTRTEDHGSIIVSDSGDGFSPETQQKLFTPFFSTKKNGQGIGLTLVREILANHGFRFSLDRINKQYTAFRIEFN